MLSCEPSLWILASMIWSTYRMFTRSCCLNLLLSCSYIRWHRFSELFLPRLVLLASWAAFAFPLQCLADNVLVSCPNIGFICQGALSVNTSMKAKIAFIDVFFRCRNRTITSCLWEDSLRYDRNSKIQDANHAVSHYHVTVCSRFTHSNPGYWQSLGPLKAKGNFAKAQRRVFEEWTATKESTMMSECITAKKHKKKHVLIICIYLIYIYICVCQCFVL